MSKALAGLWFFARCAPSFSALGYRRRQLLWPADDWRFDAQRWLVTGASDGIGRAIAEGAAKRGAHVLAVARSEHKLAELAGDCDNVETEAADLSTVAAVRAFARGLAERGETVDVLVNNVGVLLNEWQLTDEGHEASFATNLLGHFVLTEILMDGEVLAGDAAVISMSSGGMYNVRLNLDRLNEQDPGVYNGVRAYAYQKRAQVVLNRWWRRHAPGARHFYVMHPGWVDTGGVRTSLPGFHKLFGPVLRDAEGGADTALWLAGTRPGQRDDEAIWFDRKARSAHMFARTRHGDDDDALIAMLRNLAGAGAPA